MAKKAQHNPSDKKKKKRKAQSVPQKDRTQQEVMRLGSVAIPILFQVTLNATTSFNELVIEWGCLGLSEEPDSISEVTGASEMLDKKRPGGPITTSEEGLHLYFDPPVVGSGSGTYAFKILCGYNEAVEPRSSVESPEPDEPTFEQNEGERVTGG